MLGTRQVVDIHPAYGMSKKRPTMTESCFVVMEGQLKFDDLRGTSPKSLAHLPNLTHQASPQ